MSFDSSTGWPDFPACQTPSPICIRPASMGRGWRLR